MFLSSLDMCFTQKSLVLESFAKLYRLTVFKNLGWLVWPSAYLARWEQTVQTEMGEMRSWAAFFMQSRWQVERGVWRSGFDIAEN